MRIKVRMYDKLDTQNVKFILQIGTRILHGPQFPPGKVPNSAFRRGVTVGVVPDRRTFFDTRWAHQKLVRFVGIGVPLIRSGIGIRGLRNRTVRLVRVAAMNCKSARRWLSRCR